MRRLTRERYMPPEEVARTSLALAICCSHKPEWTADRAFPIECRVIGMFRGSPPAWAFEDDYKEHVRALRSAKARKPNGAELAILHLTLKRLSRGRKSTCNLW